MDSRDKSTADEPQIPDPITPEALEQESSSEVESPPPEPITPEAFEQAEAAEQEQTEQTPEKPRPDTTDVYIEREPPAHVTQSDAEIVATIPREIFNYMVIAVVFALMGGLIGYMIASSSALDSAQLAQQVADAVAPRIEQVIAAARPPSLEDPTSRFTVADDERRYTGAQVPEVVMIEFGDFNCGFCQRFVDETLPQLIRNYGDRVRFTYRDYPILAESSLTAALAAHCAADQDKFWDYHNILYSNRGRFERDSLISYAGQLQLDTEAFAACLDEERYMDTVVADYREAQTMGIRGTPAFFINGRPVSGAQPYQVFANIIEEELAAAESSTEAS